MSLCLLLLLGRSTHAHFGVLMVFGQGPLVVVIKVASDQDPSDPSKFWPPADADQIETIGTNLSLPLVTVG